MLFFWLSVVPLNAIFATLNRPCRQWTDCSNWWNCGCSPILLSAGTFVRQIPITAPYKNREFHVSRSWTTWEKIFEECSCWYWEEGRWQLLFSITKNRDNLRQVNNWLISDDYFSSPNVTFTIYWIHHICENHLLKVGEQPLPVYHLWIFP